MKSRNPVGISLVALKMYQEAAVSSSGAFRQHYQGYQLYVYETWNHVLRGSIKEKEHKIHPCSIWMDHGGL